MKTKTPEYVKLVVKRSGKDLTRIKEKIPMWKEWYEIRDSILDIYKRREKK